MLEAYPALFRLMGPQDFFRMAQIYVRHHPPKTPVMPLYGEELAVWLDAHANAFAHRPFFGNLARLEWMRRRCYYAADAKPLSGHDLERALSAVGDAGALQFSPHPACVLFQSNWPVVSLWSALQHSPAPAWEMHKKEECAIVVRPALDLMLIPVPKRVFLFFQSLFAGAVLESAVLKLENAFDLGAVLGNALDNGVFSDVQG